jgi:predicted N-acetyltransferase YhbS
MITFRHEKPTDIPAREALLDASFGEGRYAKTSERLREGRLPADGLSFVAYDRGRLIGTAQLWHISAGSERPALLLGPVAVDRARRNRGIGSALVERALRDASRLGYGAVLLVGDAPYYGRFGFSAEKTGALRLPGPYDRQRLLAAELIRGALDGAHGMISATGECKQAANLPELTAALDLREQAAQPRAA